MCLRSHWLCGTANFELWNRIFEGLRTYKRAIENDDLCICLVLYIFLWSGYWLNLFLYYLLCSIYKLSGWHCTNFQYNPFERTVSHKEVSVMSSLLWAVFCLWLVVQRGLLDGGELLLTERADCRWAGGQFAHWGDRSRRTTGSRRLCEVKLLYVCLFSQNRPTKVVFGKLFNQNSNDLKQSF